MTEALQGAADKITKLEAQLEAEREKVQVLREALRAVLSVAEKCDGWDSFPAHAIDVGENALAAAGAGGGE